jgi:hypothetical protein
MKGDYFSADTLAFLYLLQKYTVAYLIVGGEAVIYYGHSRLTGDVDFFYDHSVQNAERLFQALYAFWDGDIPGIAEARELTESGLILQFGVPPNRIDLINKIDGIGFKEAWSNRLAVPVESEQGDLVVNYIGLPQLIKNKTVADRPKDRADLVFLERIDEQES